MLLNRASSQTELDYDDDEIIEASDSSRSGFSKSEEDSPIRHSKSSDAFGRFLKQNTTRTKSFDGFDFMKNGSSTSNKLKKKEIAAKKRKLEPDESAPFTICGFSGTFSVIPKKPSSKNPRIEEKLHDADLVRKVVTAEAEEGETTKSKKSSPNSHRTISDVWKVTEEQLAKKRIQRISKQLSEMGYPKETVDKMLSENPDCATVDDAVQLLSSALLTSSSSPSTTTTITSSSDSLLTSPLSRAKMLGRKRSPPASPSKMSPLKPQLVSQKNFEREMETAAKELRTLSDVPLQLSDEDSTEKVVVDPAISSKLMDFQRDGVKFLYDLYKNDKGGILADDMGLGKTVQTIAFISAILGDSVKRGTIMKFFPWKNKDEPNDGNDDDDDENSDNSDFESDDTNDLKSDESKIKSDKKKKKEKKKKKKGPVLLVVPAGVIEQWTREFNKWLGLSVDVFHGQDRMALLQRAKCGSVRVMISSYDTFRINIEEIGTIDWDCIIFDEAHKVKNRESLGAKCHTFIRTNKRYGLTGTLMQNNFEELWTLVNFMCPNYLGSLEDFRETSVNPIKTGQRHGASLDEVAKGRVAAKRLAKSLQMIVLRRDKSIISKMLPGKDDNVVFCKLTPLQVRCYQRILASPVYKALYAMCQKCACKSGLSVAECRCPFGRSTLIGPMPSWKQEAFPAIIRLQKVANHLLLLSPDSSDDESKQLRDKQYQDIAYGDDYDEIRRLCSAGDQSALCGKIAVLKSILEKMRRAHRKVLLFSHGTRTLDLLESFLRTEGFSWERMDGTVPVMYRQKLVDKFSLNPSKLVFLLSIKASSLGFNLPSASAVILFEPDWNPSQDLQAQDRAYRIGQTAHTSVYRLVSAGTVEEMMYDRQIYKHQMAVVALDGQCTRRYFDGVAGMKGQEGELWGMANLFRFNPTDSVMTDKIIKRVTKAEERIAKDTNTFMELDDIDGNVNGNGNGNGDEMGNNEFYHSHKRRVQANNGSGDLFEKLFDPKFVVDDDDDGNNVGIIDSNSKEIDGAKSKGKSIFDEIDLDDCDGVVYSVKHNDVVEESKVERELSDRAQMRAEHQQKNAMKSVFSSLASTQMPLLATQKCHRRPPQIPSQSMFASVPTQMSIYSRAGLNSTNSNNISVFNSNNNSTNSRRCPHSLDVITLGVPKKSFK